MLFHYLEYYLECFPCILKFIPPPCYTNMLYEGLSGLCYLYLHNLILLPRLCGVFNTKKCSEKENKKTNKTSVCLTKTISEVQEGVMVRHTASVCSSTGVSRHILDPSGDWTLETFALRILKVPGVG